MPLLVVDITEFLRNPIRTGIQRVVRELLTHWPAQVGKEIVCFDTSAGKFRRVPHEIVAYCIDQADNPYLSTEEAAAAIAVAMADPTIGHIDLHRGDRVLIPELFSALNRVQHFQNLHARGVELYPIVYDLLVWTSPDAWNISYVGGLNDYLGLLFLAKRRAFISRSVRDMFFSRFLRSLAADDIVTPLGSDSLPRQHRTSLRSSPYFVCVGTLDGKKGQDAVHRAFVASKACKLVDMVFVGKVPVMPRKTMLPLLSSTDERVIVIDDPDDSELASLIQGARASIFISRHEGFGLPAVESLYLGTPVVVAADLPAMSNLESHGQIRLHGDSETELVDAMNKVSRENEAVALKAEIPRLELETWDRYAHSIATWASQ